jgi:phage gp45-like
MSNYQSIRRGFITRVDSATRPYRLQVVSLGKTLDNVYLLEPYGFHYYPPIGSEVLLLRCLNDEAFIYAIAYAAQNVALPTLQEGEVAVGDFVKGDYLHFKNNSEVVLKAATKFRVESPVIELVSNTVQIIGGELEVDLDITDRAATTPKTVQGIRTTYNIHTHNETGTVTLNPNQTI